MDRWKELPERWKTEGRGGRVRQVQRLEMGKSEVNGKKLLQLVDLAAKVVL